MREDLEVCRRTADQLGGLHPISRRSSGYVSLRLGGTFLALGGQYPYMMPDPLSWNLRERLPKGRQQSGYSYLAAIRELPDSQSKIWRLDRTKFV
jgi:hypothetical protein